MLLAAIFVAVCSLQVANTVRNNSMQSFGPAIDSVSNLPLCSVDPPSAVLPLTDDVLVGTPPGVPETVVCSFVCTGYEGCTSFNYRQRKSSSSLCELFNYHVGNCTTATNSTCHHYQVSGLQPPSCRGTDCDTNCKSGCLKKGRWKCDSLCTTGYGITADYTCKACNSSNCNDSCNIYGLGTCDGICSSGYVIHPTRHVCVKCPTGYTYRVPGDSCYKFDPIPVKTWADAQADCSSDGAHLVWIESQAEEDDMITLLTSPGFWYFPAWTGGCRKTPELPGTFVWADSCVTYYGPISATITEPFTYATWYAPTGEPNNVGYKAGSTTTGENCVFIYTGFYTFGGQWGDWTCAGIYWYICESEYSP